MILTLRTDKPESEISLFDDAGEQLAYEKWQAHRQLAETIHGKIDALLQTAEKDLAGVTGIVVYEGPGSFTGLRIGMSVANALAYSLGIPVVSTTGDDWVQTGKEKLQKTKRGRYVTPVYGAAANITKPKK